MTNIGLWLGLVGFAYFFYGIMLFIFALTDDDGVDEAIVELDKRDFVREVRKLERWMDGKINNQ